MKKTLSMILAASLLVTALAGCGGNKNTAETAQPSAPVESTPVESAAGQPHDPVTINFPTATATGALYAVGAAITNVWDTKIDYVSASSQASNGGIDNLNQISEGESQVSIAISSNCFQCLNGTDSFEGHAYEDLKVIAGLYFNPN